MRGKQWIPTDADVRLIKRYAGLGSTQEHIASLIGVSEDTLTRNPITRAALKSGKAETIAKVAGTLVKKALGGDTASAIFYLKTQARWQEVQRREWTGANGGPIDFRALEGLTAQELELYERLLQKIAFAGSDPGGDPERETPARSVN